MFIRKIKTKVGELRWELRWRDGGRGTKIHVRRFFKKIEAENFLQSLNLDKSERSARLMPSTPFSANYRPSFDESLTFETESDFWIEHRSLEMSPGYLKKVHALVKLLRVEFGGLPVMQVSPSAVSLFMGSLLREGLAPPTVGHHLQTMKAILNHSVLHERIPFNPIAKVKKPRTSKKHFQFWEEHEASEFLSFANAVYAEGGSERDKYLVFLLALNTGLRAGEIWGLRASDLNKTRGLIHVRRQFDRVIKDFRPTKGKTERLVPCGAELMRALSDWIEDQMLAEDDLIFRNQQGHAICHENFIKRVYQPLLESSGQRPIRFHDLRHTAATLMIAKGLNPALVQSILGHESITTTMNYVHVLGGDLQKARELFSVVPYAKT